MSTTARTQVLPREATKAGQSSVMRTYLVLYNFVSAILWLTVLGRTVATLGLMRSPDQVYNVTGEFTKWTQTLALAEIVHSALGMACPFHSRRPRTENPSAN
jgi:very-long-chain (3R)-3-hydroxyacyl-CoA dehydratase